MPRRRVFLDSMSLLALANRDDQHHAESAAVMASLAAQRRELITSDWVLAEFLSAASRLPLRQAGLRIVSRLRASSATEIIAATRAQWERSYQLYAARADKEWSFVDCTSMILCEDRGIREVLTADRHFAQAGFAVLLG